MSYRAINWVLQRVTGALLVILLAMHFWVEHFMADVRHGELSFQLIQSRIANPWMQAVDLSFLFVALYHGLNGLRNIILDFSIVTPKIAKLCTVIIILGGILWAYWGVTAFVGNPNIKSTAETQRTQREETSSLLSPRSSRLRGENEFAITKGLSSVAVGVH